MNNCSKNFVQGMVRAPGWSGGTIAEIGGSLKDTAKFISEWVKTGKAPAELPDRVAYTMSLMITASAINGALTYAFTGEEPKDMDYWAFRTGELDAQGRPVRFVLPTYQKDIFAYYENPGKTLMNKAHPMLGMISDLLVRNADYYGVEIRHKGDNPLEQAAQVAKYALKQFEPFWIRGLGKEAETAGREATPSGIAETVAEKPFRALATQVGVMPASAEYLNTPAQKAMSEIMRNKMGIKEQTQAEYDKRTLKNRLKMNYRAGDEEALAEARKDFEEGKISKDAFREIAKSRATTAMQDSFKHLDMEEALKVFELANEQERESLRPFLQRKLKSLKNKSLDERKELYKRYEEVVGQ
jgi:hypothetical protein